jgi:hypothetical protein
MGNKKKLWIIYAGCAPAHSPRQQLAFRHLLENVSLELASQLRDSRFDEPLALSNGHRRLLSLIRNFNSIHCTTCIGWYNNP